MKIRRIEAKTLRGGGVDGKIDDYRFQAKVFNTGSKFGIDGGRISKLEVWDGATRGADKLLSYDRGWDKKPVGAEAKDLLRTLLGYFKWFPTSEYWEELAAQEPFPVKVCRKDGTFTDARISVAAGGWGTVLDMPEGILLSKLNPVAVWELKLYEKEGKTPLLTQSA